MREEEFHSAAREEESVQLLARERGWRGHARSTDPNSTVRLRVGGWAGVAIGWLGCWGR